MKGFQRISALASRMKKLGLELQDGNAIRELIIQNEDYIVSLNKDQLNNEGINSQGVEIASYAPYAPSTVARKIRKHQPFDRVTLRDTGRFQAGFHLVVTPKTFRVTSRDRKTEELVDKYGPYIFGLTSENRNRLIQEVLMPALSDYMIKILDQ